MLLLPRNKRIALCLAMLISALAPQGRAHADAAGDWRIESPVGDGTPGTVGQPFGVELGPDGGLYICEVENHRIRRYDLETRALTTVAGTGRAGYSGDGGPALEADMNEPYEIRFDDAGNLFVVEMKNHIVRRINGKTGVITTVAGTGREGYGGDGGPATEALLKQPHSIALDGMCGLLIADIGNHRIRRVDLASGTIRTFAGNGEKTLPRDGQQAEGNPMVGPRALFVDGDTLWIALREGPQRLAHEPEHGNAGPRGRDREQGLHGRRRPGPRGHLRRPQRHRRRPGRERVRGGHREPGHPDDRYAFGRHLHHRRQRPGRARLRRRQRPRDGGEHGPPPRHWHRPRWRGVHWGYE
jgi:hypothetical protein